MLSGLFARLTGEPKRGAPLFALAVAETRQSHWFVEGAVPDSVEGRFSVLATIVALIVVRLEQFGPDGESASVGLTERFVEAMDSEVREMGVGDPSIGKQVRKLVGALGARVERIREAVTSGDGWREATLRSLYRDDSPAEEAVDHSVGAVRSLWNRLLTSSLDQINQGALP